MGIDAALGNHSQVGQAGQKVRADLRGFAEEDKGLGVLHTLRQLDGIRDVIGPDRDVMSGEFFKTRQGAQRVEPVI
jgi:hypothetical protein